MNKRHQALLDQKAEEHTEFCSQIVKEIWKTYFDKRDVQIQKQWIEWRLTSRSTISRSDYVDSLTEVELEWIGNKCLRQAIESVAWKMRLHPQVVRRAWVFYS